MTTRGVGLFLGLLTAAALGLNAYQFASNGRLEPIMMLPAAGLLVMLVSLPFLTGWRPFAAPTERLNSCRSCGTLWSPLLDGTKFCPACGGKTAPRGA